MTGKAVKLAYSVRRHWPVKRSDIFFPVQHRSPVHWSEHMALLIWKFRKLLLAHVWPMGAMCFRKGCWEMLTSGLWFFFSFSSSYWRNKHKQSAWDTMSSYIDESDLSGDETFDDIGNFDIVNLSREEINNWECQFGTLPGSSDEIQILRNSNRKMLQISQFGIFLFVH